MENGSRKFASVLDRYVARRKEELEANAERARARVRGWAAELGVESLADAARAGRWASLWAVMEERKGEILADLSGASRHLS